MGDNSHSVADQSAQVAVCRKYALPVIPPEDMVAVAIPTIGKMPIHGSRIILPKDGNISWFIHCGEFSDADDFYQPLHAAHLQEMLPLVVKYLGLPPGSRFIIDDQGYEDVWQEQPA